MASSWAMHATPEAARPAVNCIRRLLLSRQRLPSTSFTTAMISLLGQGSISDPFIVCNAIATNECKCCASAELNVVEVIGLMECSSR